MTHRDVYLADANDPDFNVVGNWAGNMPHRIGPLWPSQKQGESFGQWGVYSEIVVRAMSDQHEGCMTDWGCWVTPMTQAEILEFIDECYGDEPVYPPEWTIRGKNPDDYEIRAFVRTLDPEQKYYLVALES